MKNIPLPPLLLKKSPSAYYLYTYQNEWDPSKKRSHRTQCKKVGTVLSGGKTGRVRWDADFLSAYPDLELYACERVRRGTKGKKEIFSYVFTPLSEEGITLKQASSIRKLHAGATWALDQIVASTPIGRALRAAFSAHKDYLKILSVAYYLILNANNNVDRYDTFAEVTRLPWHGTLSASAVSRLFARIQPSQIELFLTKVKDAWLRDSAGSQLVLALDSTSISSYSKKLANVERGRNKDEDDLPQINLLMLVDAHSGLPIFYRYYDGNVPDVMTVRLVIADNARLNIKNVRLVSDKGYSSTKNINDCLRNNVDFIFNMKCGLTGSLTQSIINDCRRKLLDLNNRDWFTRVYACTQAIPWKYDPMPIKDKRAANDAAETLYWHVYYDPRIADIEQQNLLERIDRIQQKIEEEIPLDENEEDLRKELFRVKKNGFGWEIVNSRVQKKISYKGYRVLLSNCESNAREAFLQYNERWVVEDTFKTLKSRLGCSRLRVSDERSLVGKIFVQFLAASISMLVRYRLKKYANDAKINDKLQVVYESDGKILALLNNIMQTRLKEGYYFDEIAGKRKKYFQALGVPIPTAEAEDYALDEIGDVDSGEPPCHSELIV